MKDTARQLADLLLPEHQPYVVFASDCPPAAITMPNAWGATGHTADLLIHNWLADRGEWRGRAPAIFVNDLGVHEHCAKESRGNAGQTLQWELQIASAVICHEVAHVAEKSVDLSEPTPSRHEFAEAIAAYSFAVAESKARPPFDGHGWKWIRLAIHAAHRAHSHGFNFPIHFLWSGEDYATAAPEQFRFVLAQEPSNLDRESLFEINSFRPPRAFCDLWRECVNRWLDQQPNTVANVATAEKFLADLQPLY